MSDDFAAGMRQASDEIVAWHKAEITALERQIEANTDYMRREGLHDHAANDACRSSIHGHNEAIRAVERILAATPAPAPWTPPDDRPEGFECLGRGVKGSSWHHIQWNNGRWWLRSPGIQAFGLVAFAPLPPAPEDAP